MRSAPPQITPDLLLRAYAMGVFPMAENRHSPDLHWIDPQLRGILPMTYLHVSRSLARLIRKAGYRITADADFAQVLAGCADRPETWINGPIAQLYVDLHHLGHAHSVEVWQGPHLVGGIYGVAIGQAFFGESMFSRVPSGSRIALAHLVHRLAAGGFSLFDTQFLTPHLASMGGVEVPRAAYRALLADAISLTAQFNLPGYTVPQSIGASGSIGVSSSTPSG